MKDELGEIETLLTNFIAHLRTLNQCMVEDQGFFSTDNLGGLEKNDTYKLQVTSHLKLIIDELLKHAALNEFSGDLFEKLSSYTETLKTREKARLIELMETFSEEYKTGLQLLYINRQVVNASLANAKELISHLTQNSVDSKSTTYDQLGVIS